jgi:branched-chain amino acid transport system substrate-binding protein
MKRCLLVIIAIIMVGTLVLTGCSKEEAAPQTLKIGVLADLSGFLSVFYGEAVRDMQITSDYINEKGGVKVGGKTYKIELVVRDSKSSPDGALTAANQLVFEDQVKYVIGPIAFEGAATTPFLEQNKVLHIFNSTTTSDLEMGSNWPYAFSADDSALDFARIEFKIGQKEFPNAKTAVFLIPDDGSAPYLMPRVVTEMENLGYTVLNGKEAILYPNDMQDFSPDSE